MLMIRLGSRGPAVLDDFTASYGYRFFDNAGYDFHSSPYTCSCPSYPLPHIPNLDLCEQYAALDGTAEERPDGETFVRGLGYGITALPGPENTPCHKYQSPDSLYN